MIYENENPSQTIAEMAQQRYAPTAGEQKMLGQYNDRMSELDRIASAGGGVASLPDYTAAENDEKTRRWAAEDAAAKVMRGPGNRYQGVGPSFLSQQQQESLEHRARQRAELAFENGGKPDVAEELLAKMAGKYKIGNSSQPDPVPAPAPQPPQQQAQPQAKPAGGLIQQAVGIIGNRGRTIDRAAGYARGGKPPAPTVNLGIRAASGFKVKGPGTATSDSIPAKTGAGQPIRIANGERIVSVEQDQALERIAELLGFESVDAMFEAMTGKPVGPTVKGGQIAAAGGLPPTEETLHNGPYTGDGGSIVNDFQNWQAGKIAATNAKIDAARQPAVPLGNEGRSVPAPITAERPGAVSVPGSQILAAAQPVDNMRPADLTTKDILPGGYLDRGAGIVAQRGKTGQLNVTNVGTGELTDSGKQIVDGSASALIDQKNSTYNPQRQLENMQRLRMSSNATNPEITDPAVRAQAVQGMNILNAARHGAIQEQQAGTQNQLAQQQIEQAKALAGLQRELLDPATTPERRKAVQQTFAALHGKEDRANLQAIDVEEPIDPKQPLLGNKKIPYVFDPRSGQSRPMLQQASDPVSQARAAIARGADPKAVNARLKAMGLQEVK